MAHSPHALLPEDFAAACLVGRIWLDTPEGPHVCVVRPDGVFDLTGLAPTMADLLEIDAAARAVRAHSGARLCDLDTMIAATFDRPGGEFSVLAPCDLQAIKACGVTFVESMLERVIEERAKGDARHAALIRREIQAELGVTLSNVVPGSEGARAVKARLTAHGLWSQYLEVGLGPDAEIFTKAQPMSAVGAGAQIGIHPKSSWNNPEPEVVLACNSAGKIQGAALGNDVNLRDFEGRSALLLSKAKDNNASCAIGPFIRLFDGAFTPDDIRRAEVALEVIGPDGFRMTGTNPMAHISRDPAELVRQTCSAEHQYPDGFMLFLGTMFAPTQDRDAPDMGFTHKIGDRVRISSARLGSLENTVVECADAPPWRYGVRALMRSLSKRAAK